MSSFTPLDLDKTCVELRLEASYLYFRSAAQLQGHVYACQHLACIEQSSNPNTLQLEPLVRPPPTADPSTILYIYMC